jgi:hypothetical protein
LADVSALELSHTGQSWGSLPFPVQGNAPVRHDSQDVDSLG